MLLWFELTKNINFTTIMQNSSSPSPNSGSSRSKSSSVEDDIQLSLSEINNYTNQELFQKMLMKIELNEYYQSLNKDEIVKIQPPEPYSKETIDALKESANHKLTGQCTPAQLNKTLEILDIRQQFSGSLNDRILEWDGINLGRG